MTLEEKIDNKKENNSEESIELTISYGNPSESSNSKGNYSVIVPSINIDAGEDITIAADLEKQFRQMYGYGSLVKEYDPVSKELKLVYTPLAEVEPIKTTTNVTPIAEEKYSSNTNSKNYPVKKENDSVCKCKKERYAGSGYN